MNPNTINQMQANGVPQTPVQPVQPQHLNAIQPMTQPVANTIPTPTSVAPVNIAPVVPTTPQAPVQPEASAEVKKPSGGKKIVLSKDPIIRPVTMTSLPKTPNLSATVNAPVQEQKQEMPTEQTGSITF